MHCRFCCYGLSGQEAQITLYQPQLPEPQQTGNVYPIHVANQSCQLPVAPLFDILSFKPELPHTWCSILNQRGSATFHPADCPAPHFLCCQGEINKDACCQPELPINAVFAVSATLLSNVCCSDIYNTLKIWKSCWFQQLLKIEAEPNKEERKIVHVLVHVASILSYKSKWNWVKNIKWRVYKKTTFESFLAVIQWCVNLDWKCGVNNLFLDGCQG